MESETVRLPIAEAADRLGVSVDTIRRKIKRGQMPAIRDNTGRWLVEISADAKSAYAAPPMQSAYAPMQHEEAALSAALREQIVFLKSQIDQARGERATLNARIVELEERAREAEERARAAEERHRTEMAAERATAAAERDKLLDIVQSAQKSARPWWRRLRG